MGRLTRRRKNGSTYIEDGINMLGAAVDKLADFEDKDEPAKVVIRDVKYKKPAWRMPKTRPAPFCPACTERLMHSGAHHCEFCGQRLDWKV